MKRLGVSLGCDPAEPVRVGELAESGGRVYFEYDREFLGRKLDLSPFKLPLSPPLIEHKPTAFGSVFGLFADSLPDAWGRLLMDRSLRKQGLDPVEVSTLDRLAWLGNRTMGALTYHPPAGLEDGPGGPLDLLELEREAVRVLEGETQEVLPALVRAGGSAGGARPKVLVGVSGDRILSGEGDLPDDFLAAGGEHWMVKFAAVVDAPDAGPVEYAYSRMAGAAGVDMPPTRLFEAEVGRTTHRWFGVRRFDRHAGNRRRHVQTYAGLFEQSAPYLTADYQDLLKVTSLLTRDHREVVKLFRLMVFNAVTHNRDDHGRNFAFILDEETGLWSLSPAYDLTFCRGPGGEHSTTLRGEGRRPTRSICLELAGAAGLSGGEAKAVIEQTLDAASRWRGFASDAGCSKKSTAEVEKALVTL